jgi:hypothetical protein
VVPNPNFKQYKVSVNLLTGLMLILASGHAIAGENASNPLAAVNSTDLRLQYFDLDGPYLIDAWLDGAYMLNPKVKLKYELHHWTSDQTGTRQSNFESLHLKGIWFPTQGEWGSWKYKPAIGLEWIKGWGNDDLVIGYRSIGSSADQLGPFVGLSMVKGGTVLVPLLQHFVSYDGPDVKMTAARLIAIQSLANNYWGKLDLIVPVDWENDNAIPATAEMQLGRMFSPSFGVYADVLLGVGGDKPYDWGVGVGVRFNY